MKNNIFEQETGKKTILTFHTSDVTIMKITFLNVSKRKDLSRNILTFVCFNALST